LAVSRKKIVFALACLVILALLFPFVVRQVKEVRALLRSNNYVDYCRDETSGRFIRDYYEREVFCEAHQRGEIDHPEP